MRDEPDAAGDRSGRARPGGGPRPPRPLSPSRPWQGADTPQAGDADSDPVVTRSRPVPASQRPVAADLADPAPDAVGEREVATGLAPNRPWRHEAAPATPEPIGAPADQDDRDASPTGLAPVRPWSDEHARPAGERRSPQPSNPDVVLTDLAAEVGPDREAETDDERRRRFARQHAAADAARLADPPNLIDNGPPPPSYEPDPAVYDVTTDGDGEPKRRRFGRRRRDDGAAAELEVTAPPGTEPVYSAPPVTEPVFSAPAEVPPAVGPRHLAPVLSAAPASYEPAPTPDEPVAPPAAAEPVEPPLPRAEVTPPAAADEDGPVSGGRPSRWRRRRAQSAPVVAPPPEPVVPPAVVPAAADVPAAGPTVTEPTVTEPAVTGVPDAPSTEPGPVTKATRWLLERAPEPGTETTPEPVTEAVDVTDAPALDLELADEFHGELEAPTSGAPVTEVTPPVVGDEPADPGTAPAGDPQNEDTAAVAPSAASPRVRRGWRRRHAPKTKDDDEGPFFPPEPADDVATTPVEDPSVPSSAAVPTLVLPSVASVLDDVPLPAASEVPAVPVSSHRPRPRPRPTAAVEPPVPPSSDTPPPAPEQLSPARQRPRPRPAAARAAAAPAAETSTEPDPAGPSAPPPSAPSEVRAPEPAGAEPEPAEPTSAEPGSDAGTAASSDADDAPGHRSPDISRYLSATEPGRDDKGPQAEEPMRRRRRLRGSRGLRVVTKLAIVLVVAVVAAVVLRAYVVAPYYIPSASMEPALQGGGGTNDRILVDKITYHVHDPHQGDIVVFDRPDTWRVPDKTLVKRIVGLPGDVVSLRAGLVYVDGTRLTENYINKACGPAATKPLTGTSTWKVPMGDYFVMGDNRCDSEDSRAFGPIPGSKIVGRAFLIVWPLKRFGSP